MTTAIAPSRTPAIIATALGIASGALGIVVAVQVGAVIALLGEALAASAPVTVITVGLYTIAALALAGGAITFWRPRLGAALMALSGLAGIASGLLFGPGFYPLNVAAMILALLGAGVAWYATLGDATHKAGSLPRWADVVLLPLLNVTLAFLIGGLIVMLVGQNPLDAVRLMLYGAFGYGSGFGYTLYYTTDFIFAGLAVSLAYHAGLFNIGPEGQAYIGGLGVILAALALNGLHWAIVLPVVIIAGGLFGAFWAFIPGVLQAKRGSHIVITTILFNFIAISVMSYLITRVLKPAGVNSDESAPIDAISRVPQLRLFWDLFKNSPVNVTFILAILALIFVYWLVWRTKFGYAMRALGHNPTAARYAGISNARMIMITMALSGALAGMVAVNNVGGVQGRLILNFVGGAGFVGIAVAFMGRAHPIGVALAALLFGALYQGGQELAFSMPGITREMIVTIQALVILFTGAMGDMLRGPLERLFARRAAGGS